MPQLQIGLATTKLEKLDYPLLVVAVTDEEVVKGVIKGKALLALDAATGGILGTLALEAEFEGRSGSELVAQTHGRFPAARIALVGVGKARKLGRDAARDVGARTVKLAERVKAKRAALIFPFNSLKPLLESAATGAILGTYKFDKFLSEAKPRRLEQLDFVSGGGKPMQAAIDLGVSIGNAVNHARELVNEPPNELGPAQLADVAKKIAKDTGLEHEILDRKDIEKLGMNMFLGVTQGSERPPKLIHLWWSPSKTKLKPVALVGKAITFDSGGLSLKTAAGMETMKCDMGGAAAVLGVMSLVAKLQPKFPVHAFIGACENMPSGTAQRPGDIVRSRAGKTVEILNTDAEGRLVLGDVLAWARDFEPSCIIDLATLTGAVTVALGPYTTGFYSNDSALQKEIATAAHGGGESMWNLPLLEDLKELIKSPVADLKNTGGPRGGSITAALFLREFVGETAWAHLDIAGPAFLEKDHGLDPRGGTGHGVRTLFEFLRNRE